MNTLRVPDELLEYLAEQFQTERGSWPTFEAYVRSSIEGDRKSPVSLVLR